MKRVVVFFIAMLALICPLFVQGKSLNTDDVTKVCVVMSEEVKSLCECEVIKNGNQFYYTMSLEEYNSSSSIFKSYDAINLFYEKDVSMQKLLKAHNITSYYLSSVEGMDVLYGYTNNFSDFRMVDGKKINVQIVWKKSETIVGFPLIVTGY